MKNPIRMKNALWGLFISDSLCMPAHWYYKRKYLQRDFGTISGYRDATHPHPESFMVGNGYFPDIETAKQLDRSYDILHQHINFYNTSYSHLEIKTKVHDGEHANLMPQIDERYHYHHGLKAGENTLGANLVRVLMRSVIKNGKYDEKSFLDDFVEYMTSEGKNRDPYSELYIRDWFENYSKGLPPELCANTQRDRWSIGSHGGIIRPLVLSFTSNPYDSLGIAITHQQLTHRSQNVSSALATLVPLLSSLISDEEPTQCLEKAIKDVALIKIHGQELSKRYAEAQGPGNIPKDEMWKIHTEYSNEYLSSIINSATDENMITTRFATACYPEHGLPLILYFLYKNSFEFKSSLFDNANAGGDNVHRGMILGLLVGATADGIPQDLKSGLLQHKEIEKEIDSFIKIIRA